MKLVAPSILSADFSRLGEEVSAVEKAGADWIHVDVRDGHFVPNMTMWPLIVEAVRRTSTLPIDVHLMIEAPDRYIADFAKAGAAFISVQVEACIHLNRTIQHIRETGACPGVVLNPSTPLESLAWVLGDVEFVLIMSVNPGFGGQTFIPGSLDKIKELRKMITDRGLATLIQIDGGVNPENIRSIVQAGADVCVAGSAIYGTRDYKKTMDDFRRRLAG